VDGDRIPLQGLNSPHDESGCVQVGVGGGVDQPPGNLGRVAGLAGEADPDRPAVLQQRAPRRSSGRASRLPADATGDSPQSEPIGGLTVRCSRNDRRPAGRCPAHADRLDSVAMLVSAAVRPLGRVAGCRLLSGGHHGVVCAVTTADMATHAARPDTRPEPLL
jgi:hypothetical protein